VAAIRVEAPVDGGTPAAGEAKVTITASTGRRSDVRRMFDAWPSGVSIATNPAQGIITCLVPGVPASPIARGIEPLVLKVPTGPASAAAVEREARLLVELRRKRLGPVENTIPRHVGMRDFDGLPVAVSSTVPGRPMSVANRHWVHAAQPWRVRRDLQYAAEWLSMLHEASATNRARITWVSDVTDALHDRWLGHPLLEAGLAMLAPIAARLDRCRVDLTVVHGDFWHGNVLVDVHRGAVSGVVNWMSGQVEGCPLPDLATFAIRYSRHVAPGASRWYPRMVRAYLCDGLRRVGLPTDRWGDVARAGVAQIAAHEGDERMAEEHLALLSRDDSHAPLLRLT
jgi:hypothetical protein